MSNLWNDGSDGSSYVVNESGNYWLKVTDKNGCTFADTVYVRLESEYNLNIQLSQKYSFKGDTIALSINLIHKKIFNGKKYIDFVFEVDDSLIQLLPENIYFENIGKNNNKTIYKVSIVRTVSNDLTRDISFTFRFVLKNVDPNDYEISVNSLYVNNCEYLDNPENLNIILSDSKVVKVGKNTGSDNSFEVYPTPFNSKLNFMLKISDYNNVIIQISDLLGRVKDKVKFIGLSHGLFQYELNTESYLDGFYNICMIINDEVICKKSVKIVQ